MDPKTILVHVAPNQGDAPHIKAAASLARLFGAELLGVGAEAFRPVRDPMLSHLDGLQVAAVRKRIELQLEAAKASFLQCGGGVPCAWRTFHDDPDDTLVSQAARADLIVAASSRTEADWRTTAETDDLIIEAGLPVLVTPPQQTSVTLRRVLIGWKNTREARRAIADAIPFLQRAGTVEVVAVAEGKGEASDAHLADVVARLAAHGVQAAAETAETAGASAGEVLLQLARDRSADVLVVGAYGRSRVRQWVFGGVTSHLLAHPDKPVLFSR